MASNYVLNQKITAALAKSAEALVTAQNAGGGGGGGGGIGSLSEVLDTARTTAPTATDGDALHFPIKNAGEIESTNHQIIKHGLAVNSTPTALGDITFDSANGDNLLIKTVGTRNIQIGATSGTDTIGIGKVPNSVGSKIQVDGSINCDGSYLGEGFTLTDTNGALHALATYDLATTRIQLGSISDDFRIRAPSSALYDFTASEMMSTEKVRFDNAGLHTPTTLATRQNGDRVVLYSPASGTNDQYTLGIEGGAVRMSSGQSFKFYYRPPTYFTDLAVGESEAFRIESATAGTNQSFRPFTNQGDLKVLDSTATTTSLHVDTTYSRVGINKANPTEDLDVDGNIQGTGSLKFYDNTGGAVKSTLSYNATDDKFRVTGSGHPIELRSEPATSSIITPNTSVNNVVTFTPSNASASNYGGSFTPDLAFNSNFAQTDSWITFWQSPNAYLSASPYSYSGPSSTNVDGVTKSGEWLQMDFGSGTTKFISKFQISTYSDWDSNVSGFMHEFIVAGSTDGSSFTEIGTYDQSNIAKSATSYKSVEISSTNIVSSRYIRLIGVRVNLNMAIREWEMQEHPAVTSNLSDANYTFDNALFSSSENIQIDSANTGRLIFKDSVGSHEHGSLDAVDDGTNGGKLVLKTKTDGGAVGARITVDGVGAIGIGPTPNYGTSGQVLTSQGPATTPIWATPSGGGGGTTVYGGTWSPNLYTFYYVPAGQIMYANYYTPGDTVNNPWYSSTYNGDSHGRYAVTVFPGTPNRYKVDLWFKLYCGGSGSTANDIYKWGYNLQATSTSVNGAIRHGGFGSGATAGVTFDAAGNINGGQLTLECGFDVSDFMTKINAAVGTNLTFDTALVPGNEVNLGNSVFYEHVVSPTGVIRPLGQSYLNNLVFFNENGWARGFDPTDADPQDANIPAGTGDPLTSLGWTGVTNGNPQIVPFGKSPSDIFSMTNSSVSGSEFYSINNASTRGSIRQFGGTLSYWMVEA